MRFFRRGKREARRRNLQPLRRACPAARRANMAGRESRDDSGNNGRGGAAFRVQNQIRRNAQDMQEYLADLGSWERSIKKKDK